MGLEVDWKWILALEILIGLSLSFIKDNQREITLISLFVIPVIYLIGMRLYNFYFEKIIDETIQEG
jgi:hypothetical protein